MKENIVRTPPGMTDDQSSIVAKWFVKNGSWVSENTVVVRLESGDFCMELKAEYTGQISYDANEGQKTCSNYRLFSVFSKKD